MASAVEYGITALIAVAIIAGASGLEENPAPAAKATQAQALQKDGSFCRDGDKGYLPTPASNTPAAYMLKTDTGNTVLAFYTGAAGEECFTRWVVPPKPATP
jgi:hypothetical protein